MSAAFSVFIQSLRLAYQNIGALLRMNLLWLLCSLPIITWPSATAALYAVCYAITRGQEVNAQQFFAGFKRYFVAGLLLGVINSLLLVVLAYGVAFYFNQPDWLQLATGPSLLLLVLFLLLQLYLYPLLVAQTEPRLMWMYRNAIILVLRHPLFSLAMFVLLTVWLLLCLVLAGPILFIAAPVTAMIQCQTLKALLPEHISDSVNSEQ